MSDIKDTVVEFVCFYFSFNCLYQRWGVFNIDRGISWRYWRLVLLENRAIGLFQFDPLFVQSIAVSGSLFDIGLKILLK